MSRQRRDTRRSPEATAWRRLYSTPAWRSLRARKRRENPLCERCEAHGFVIAAAAVNHRIPHKGDLVLFFDYANLQSVCTACHDGPIQSEERTGSPNDRVGYQTAVRASGLPSDPRHPFFAGR